MNEPYERLQTARAAAGFENAVDAARAFGWNDVTYRAHENGTRGLRPDVAARYARAFKVSTGWLLTGEGGTGGGEPQGARLAARPEPIPVVGRTAAGVFREVIEYDDGRREYVFDEPDPEFPNARRFALEVEGDSMNRLEPRPILDGDRVICVDFTETGLPLEHGMIVVAQRRDGDRIEWSVKQIELHGTRTELHPRSSNKRWRPIVYEDDPDAERSVEIIGLVRSVNYGVPRSPGWKR